MRRRLRLLYWFGVAYLAACSMLALFLVHVTLHPNRRPFSASADARMSQIAEKVGAQLEDVGVTAPDGAVLRAWYLHQKPGNGNAAILLHGLGDNRLGTIGYAQILLAHGYDVLMPDARAHGISGGDLATYGLVERNDIRQWFEWLELRDQPHCIFGFAESMGAAQLLQALDAEPNFCAVVAESSFSNFREIAYDRMGQQFHTGPWLGRTLLRPVVELALAYTRWKYHLKLAEASPEDSVARTHVPVLLIHGQIDGNIPVRHSRRIALRNSNVLLWEVPGADHCGAISAAPEDFEARLVSWFSQHQTPSLSEVPRALTISRGF